MKSSATSNEYSRATPTDPPMLGLIGIFNSGGKVVATFGNHCQETGDLGFPTNIPIDSSRRLHFADSMNNRIQIPSPDGISNG